MVQSMSIINTIIKQKFKGQNARTDLENNLKILSNTSQANVIKKLNKNK